MAQKNLFIRRNQTFILIFVGIIILAVGYFHSLNLNVIQKIHLYTDSENLYLVYQKKPLLPKELNTYLAKVDLEKKVISRPIFKRAFYSSGFAQDQKLWLFHKNALSAYEYVPSAKNSIFLPKFDYVQYFSPEYLGLEEDFLIYEYGELRGQAYLFGSKKPDAFSIWKLDSHKSIPLNLTYSAKNKFKRFQLSNLPSQIYLGWQLVEHPKTLYVASFDGKELSKEIELSFEEEVQHFSFFGQNSQILLYLLNGKSNTIFYKTQQSDGSWSKESKTIHFASTLSFSSLSTFSVCQVKETLFLAIANAGTPYLLSAESIEKEWNVFKPEKLNSEKNLPVVED